MDHSENMTPSRLSALQESLAAQRHIAARTESAAAEVRARPPIKVVQREMTLDSRPYERESLEFWPTTELDFCTGFRIGSDGKIDAGFGPGISPATNQKYFLRSTHWPTVGEVVKVSGIEMWLAKRESGHSSRPRFEPCTGPERSPIFAKCHPSSPAKARAIAARGLRKPEADLTLEQIVKWFWDWNPKSQAFKG